MNESKYSYCIYWLKQRRQARWGGRMSHWSSMVGEVGWEWAGEEATEGCSLMS